MLRNYVNTALRSLSKNKLYSLINVAGLTIGLVIYVFSQLIGDYERNHDVFFPNSERIFAIYAIFQPDAGIGIRSSSGIQTSVAPLIPAEIPEIEATARFLAREYLARYGDRKFYQGIRFADPDFLKIFQFEYLAGNPETALDDPHGLIVTQSMARKYFGSEDAIGKVITFNNEHDLRVTAVIADIPRNSHFSVTIIQDSTTEMIANIEALVAMSNFELNGNWDNISTGDTTYVLLPENMTPGDADAGLARLYDEHVSDQMKELVAAYEVRELKDLNLYPWEATGLPVITSIEVLGFLILIIAVLNYTNLATAQVMGRTREVGMRRTLGASARQLFSQFLVESTTLATLALVLAVAIIQVALPLVNDATGKVMSFDFLSDPALIGQLVMLVVLVGLFAGSYPAYLISRVKTVGMLNREAERGKRAGLLRTAMLVIQFSIALFMIIAVSIIYAQNSAIEKSSHVFAKDRIVTLARVGRDDIRNVVETLRAEMERLPGVKAMTLSSQVPFEQRQSQSKYSVAAGDEAQALDLHQVSIDREFLDVYDFELLAGRNFSVDHADDVVTTDEDGNPTRDTINVIVNEMAMTQLGISTPADAVGSRFFRLDEDGPNTEQRIIGVIPDVNFLGFHNELKPIVFFNRPESRRIASIRIEGEAIPETLVAIDEVWDRVVPAYPIHRRFLDEHFQDVFGVFQGINAALAGFAVMALLVALIGLFGMAAFMAERRTREVGMRKVMGASVAAIVRLLVWQFSRPVLIAIAIASPLGYLAAGFYLDFFAERISLTPALFAVAGILVLVFAWATVIVHATNVARANPIRALRYE